MTNHSSVRKAYSISAQKLNISTENFGKCPNVILVDDIVTFFFVYLHCYRLFIVASHFKIATGRRKPFDYRTC